MALRWFFFVVAAITIAAAANASAETLSVLTSCLSDAKFPNVSFPSTASFDHLLRFSMQNLRFTAARTPAALLLPAMVSDVQSAIRCTLRSGLEIRVRGGGHSYEGLSYTAAAAFVVLDLMNMNHVSVDLGSGSAWVQGGATIGELYAAIARASPEYGFSAGLCPTVGVGGHIAGGGHGALCRKHGVAADNVMDAQLVDAEGRVLDRAGMGEDVFWALRGGGGGSWGVVAAWKLRLVRVPAVVSTLSVEFPAAGVEAAAEMLERWQVAAPKAPEELWLAASLKGKNGGGVSVKFTGQYLGGAAAAAAAVGVVFPELGVRAADWQEGTWGEAAARLGGVAGVAELGGREYGGEKRRKLCMKAKSDYAMGPMPKEAWEEAARKLAANPGGGDLILEPYGGAMAEAASDAIAFPHRAASFVLQYRAQWAAAAAEAVGASREAWVRDFYGAMTPYVSRNPRSAYVNYVDLDLGSALTAVEAESSWGSAYFLSNFHRLVKAKSLIDPSDVFHHPQSIPVR